MRGDKLCLGLYQGSRRLRRPLATLRSPHILFLLALLLAHLTVLVSATTNYTFYKQDPKHVGYWVDEKASRVTKLTLDAGHYWVTSSTFQAACKLGHYFNDCPMPTRCIKEYISTSFPDPRYKPYREVVEYDNGSRETCFNDEHPPTPFPSTPFTPSSCMPMTITLAPYYANNAPDVQGRSRYANLGCRPLYDDNGSGGWNPKNVIYAALGTAIGATQTAAAAGLKLVETRIVMQNEIPSRTRTDDNSRDNNDDDDVPLLGGASIYTDEDGLLHISDGPTSTSTSTSTGRGASTTSTSYSTTMATSISPPGHPPAISFMLPSETHSTVTTQMVPGQDQLAGEDFDPMETAIAAATNRTTTRTSTNTGTTTGTDSTTDTGTPTDTDTPTPTDTDTDTDPEKQQEDGDDRTTKYEGKNKKWITAAIVMGSITGGIFTCLAAWCVLSRRYIRRVLRIERRRSPSPSAGQHSYGCLRSSLTKLMRRPLTVFLTGLTGLTGQLVLGRIKLVRDEGGGARTRRHGPNDSQGQGHSQGQGQGQDEEEGRISQDNPFQDPIPPWQQQQHQGGVGHGNGLFETGDCTRDCRDCVRDCEKRGERELKRKTGTTQLSIIDEVTEPGSKRGSGVESASNPVEEEVEEEGRDSWPASPLRLLESPDEGYASTCKSGEVVDVYIKRESGASSLGGSSSEKVDEGVEGEGEAEVEEEVEVEEKRGGLKKGTQLSIIDEVTEPGSKRGSGVESTSSPVEEEVRDSWPALPDRLLGSPDDRSADGRESGEVVHVYLGQ